MRPDVVLHGMWPFASLAARMLGLPAIAFLPLPLRRICVTAGLLCDLPDPVPVPPRLLRPARRALARAGRHLMTRAPIFHQHRPGAAAAACGWPNRGALNLCEAIRAVRPIGGAGADQAGDDWTVVVLAPPSVCRLDEARAVAGDDPRILVTDRFVLGSAANVLAGVVVAHGGQGAVLTAMAAGVPIVGWACRWSSR
jgi:hypothetical protein